MLKLKQPSVVLTELLGELIEGFEFYNQRNDSRPGLLLHALHTGILDRLHTHTHTVVIVLSCTFLCFFTLAVTQSAASCVTV